MVTCEFSIPNEFLLFGSLDNRSVGHQQERLEVSSSLRPPEVYVYYFFLLPFYLFLFDVSSVGFSYESFVISGTGFRISFFFLSTFLSLGERGWDMGEGVLLSRFNLFRCPSLILGSSQMPPSFIDFEPRENEPEHSSEKPKKDS